jgi:hypothetical protein
VVYHHFRSLGWVVRPGVKFGVEYRELSLAQPTACVLMICVNSTLQPRPCLLTRRVRCPGYALLLAPILGHGREAQEERIKTMALAAQHQPRQRPGQENTDTGVRGGSIAGGDQGPGCDRVAEEVWSARGGAEEVVGVAQSGLVVDFCNLVLLEFWGPRSLTLHFEMFCFVLHQRCSKA